MKRRIKVLYLLTIAAIVAFGWFEGIWLVDRYESELVTTQYEMFAQAKGIFRKDCNRRRDMLGNFGTPSTQVQNYRHGDSIKLYGEILLVSRNEHVRGAVFEMAKEGRLKASYYKDFQVESDWDLTSDQMIDAMAAFVAQKYIPLRTDSMAAVIDSVFGGRSEVRVERCDSLMWEARMQNAVTKLNPRMTLFYPINTLGNEVAVVEIPVPVSETFGKLAATFALSLLVAILLIFCLVYQMATIRRQQKIAELQKSYTLTMLHELKRPLGALKLFISFMKNERLDAADREAALANGAREIENLSSYFNKLRAITYNEASEVPLSLSPFNLREAVEESAAMIPDAAVSMQGADGVAVVAERQSMVNVLSNLIENAVKYSKTFENLDDFENIESSKTLVEISWKFLDGSLELSVADRGRGIPDAEKPFIFDQFYRAGKSAGIPGMGLGLAYVRQIIEAHGGTISVKDRDGGGTVFTINLPQ